MNRVGSDRGGLRRGCLRAVPVPFINGSIKHESGEAARNVQSTQRVTEIAHPSTIRSVGDGSPASSLLEALVAASKKLGCG